MTCGIYKLVFCNTNSVYVGKSLSIERRFSDHLYAMKTGKEPKKLQEAYTSYGSPTLNIIEECTTSLLDTIETLYIKQLDAVRSGFNTLELSSTMPCYYGEDHPGSLYSNLQVEEVFHLLVDSELSRQQISATTKVSTYMINHIAVGNCHGWLREKYPEKYLLLLNKVKRGSTSAQRGAVLPLIKSPEGMEYLITNIRAFSRAHNLPYSSLNSLLNFRTNNTKGWSRV